MKTYMLRFNKFDQNLIDITCIHPEPTEAFAFVPITDEKVEVTTVNEKRFALWLKTLKEANKEFEVVED